MPVLFPSASVDSCPLFRMTSVGVGRTLRGVLCHQERTRLRSGGLARSRRVDLSDLWHVVLSMMSCWLPHSKYFELLRRRFPFARTETPPFASSNIRVGKELHIHDGHPQRIYLEPSRRGVPCSISVLPTIHSEQPHS